MSGNQQGADTLAEGRAKASLLAGSDRIGLVVARYFDLISSIKRNGLGAESVNELVELLANDREFAIRRDNNVSTPMRDLMYDMVESFGSLIEDLTNKRALEIGQMLGQLPVQAGNSSNDNNDLFYSEPSFPLSPNYLVKDEEEEEEIQVVGSVIDGVATGEELAASATASTISFSEEEPCTSSKPPTKRLRLNDRLAERRDAAGAAAAFGAAGSSAAAAASTEHRCIVCSEEFDTFASLLTHSTVHKPNAQNKKKKRIDGSAQEKTPEKETYHCPLEFCKAYFLYPSGLSYHMLRHTGERPHKCTRCTEGFINSADLKMHLRDRHGERPYICTICGEKFDLRMQLTQHRRSEHD